MKRAFAQAEKAAEAGEVPIGAVIVEGETVVAQAHNQVETLHDPTAHAEMLAITQAAEHRGDWRLDGMTIYTTTEPCPMCAGAMILARLDRVVFGAEDPRVGAAGSILDIFDSARHMHSVDVVPGVLARECGMILQEFFKKRRAKSS